MIVGAEPGFATFTLHDLGEIRLEVVDSRGDEYQGALSVFLARRESRGAGAGDLSGRMATFLRPPYALSALRQGSYSVVLVTPTSSRPPDMLQVWPGESTVQLMQLDDTR